MKSMIRFFLILLILAPLSPAHAGLIQPVSTTTAGFVGMAATGPLDQPVFLTSYAHFALTFGSSTAGLANPYLAPSVATSRSRPRSFALRARGLASHSAAVGRMGRRVSRRQGGRPRSASVRGRPAGMVPKPGSLRARKARFTRLLLLDRLSPKKS